MNIKLFGAIIVVAGCGAWGFLIAAQYLHRLKLLRSLVSALDYMECELQYRVTALPALCRQTGEQSTGKIRALFLNLSEELEAQISPNVECCMASALEKCGELPPVIRKLCKNLGNSMGKFDLQGQLRGLEATRAECRRKLEQLQTNHEVRMRSYQTLGICAGAAIAILFI